MILKWFTVVVNSNAPFLSCFLGFRVIGSLGLYSLLLMGEH